MLLQKSILINQGDFSSPQMYSICFGLITAFRLIKSLAPQKWSQPVHLCVKYLVFIVWLITARPCPAFASRNHVCVLQSTAQRQTGAGLHFDFSSQRFARCCWTIHIILHCLVSISLSWAHADDVIIFISLPCRLQQDIQSVAGQRWVATQSRTAPSSLHPHRWWYIQKRDVVVLTYTPG